MGRARKTAAKKNGSSVSIFGLELDGRAIVQAVAGALILLAVNRQCAKSDKAAEAAVSTQATAVTAAQEQKSAIEKTTAAVQLTQKDVDMANKSIGEVKTDVTNIRQNFVSRAELENKHNALKEQIKGVSDKQEKFQDHFLIPGPSPH